MVAAGPEDPLRPRGRAAWVALLRRVFEVDPLLCRRCGDQRLVVAGFTEPPVIDKIVRHRTAALPEPSSAPVAAAYTLLSRRTRNSNTFMLLTGLVASEKMVSMGTLRAIAVLSLLLSAAFGQETAPAIREEPEVAPSEAAAALAAETVARLNALHYRIGDTEAPGFVAAYSVRHDGAPAGRIELAWTREGNSLACDHPGPQRREWRKGVADIVRLGFDASLVRRRDARDVLAERRDGKVVLDRRRHLLLLLLPYSWVRTIVAGYRGR